MTIKSVGPYSPFFDCTVCGASSTSPIASAFPHKPWCGAPYGEWCHDPKICAGKGYCPRDPTCGD